MAEQDLTDILLYYADKVSILFANKMLVKIKEETESLHIFPNRSRKGRVAGTRECVINHLPFIAIITIDEASKTVTVLNILHTSRKYP